MKNTKPIQTISEEEIAKFYREGYIVIEGLAPDEAIKAVLNKAKEKPVEAGGSWNAVIFDHSNPIANPDLHRLLVEPRIVNVVERIFEAPARVYYGMLAVVPAHGGKGLEWHQDNMYDLVLGRALNVFIALCDITSDKGMLWISPKSHLKGVEESLTQEGHRVAKEPANGEALPTLKRGSVVIFDRNTLHRSKSNETNEDRYAYAAQYQEDRARNSITGEKDSTKMLVTELRDVWRQE